MSITNYKFSRIYCSKTATSCRILENRIKHQCTEIKLDRWRA